MELLTEKDPVLSNKLFSLWAGKLSLMDLKFTSRDINGLTLNSLISLELYKKVTNRKRLLNRVNLTLLNGLKLGSSLLVLLKLKQSTLRLMESLIVSSLDRLPTNMLIRSLESKLSMLVCMMSMVLFSRM